MENYFILCVDDEPEILDAVTRALAPFEDFFPIETASCPADARDVLTDIHEKGHCTALIICDQVMPEESGVSLLTELAQDPDHPHVRKILLTGQASHADTIAAINQGGIDYYVAKPWDEAELKDVVSTQLAHYFVNSGKNPGAGLERLDATIISEAIRQGALMSDR